MQVKNKKQLLITLLSVLVSVFLVAGAAYATLTFSGTTITLSNNETIANTTDGKIDVSISSTSGSDGFYVQAVTTTGTAVDLKGIRARATATATATSGTIKGIESTARAITYTGGGSGGGDLTEITAFYGSADVKQGTTDYLRGIEVSLDGEAGGTATLAQGVLISNNSSGVQTTSYALDINSGTATGHKAFTADIRLSDGSTIAAGSIDGTTLRSIVITPKASATTASIGYHESVRIPMTFGDPDHRTYGLALAGERSGAATASFDGTDTSLDIRMTNDEANNAAYKMQGMYIKARNSSGGTVGNLTGAKIEIDSRSGSTVTNIKGLEVYLSQDAAGVSGNVIGINITDDNQDTTSGTYYGLLINTSGGYSMTRQYGIYLDSDSGSWTNALSLDGAITNVLDFADTNGTNGAKVATITFDATADALVKIDIGGTAYYIPAWNAAGTDNEW